MQSERNKMTRSQLSVKKTGSAKNLDKVDQLSGMRTALGIGKSIKSKASKEKTMAANNIQIVSTSTKAQNLKEQKEQQLKCKMIAKQLKQDIFIMNLKSTSVSNKAAKNARQSQQKDTRKKIINTLIDVTPRSPLAHSADRPSLHGSASESENISFSEASPQLVYRHMQRLTKAADEPVGMLPRDEFDSVRASEACGRTAAE